MVRTCAGILLVLFSSIVYAEVQVETYTGTPSELREMRQAPVSAPQLSLVPKGVVPADDVWFIPLFEVDTTNAAASSTFFSIRNEGDFNTNVLVEYFGRVLAPPRLQSQRFVLIPDQIVSVDVRAVGGLAVEPDGFARGLIRITPRIDDPISVDVFRIDAANNFASGAPAFTVGDFCDFWQVRFLDFGGPNDGTVMTALVNGPRGLGDSPPTISGTVFNQQGQPINNFNIRTNEWAIRLPLLDFVQGETAFGSIELVLNAASRPGGVVSVSHSAQGRFSIGTRGVCKDGI